MYTCINELYYAMHGMVIINNDYLQLITKHAASLTQLVTSTPQSHDNQQLYSDHEPDLLYYSECTGASLHTEYSYAAVECSGQIRPKGYSKDNIELESCVAYGTKT